MAEPTRSDLPFYLRGIHAPVDREVESFELPVEGTIPPEIDGLFVRNGPNPAKGDPGHWFLGDGMLHGVRFERGRPAWYRNRFVRTRALAGEARYIGSDGSVDFTAGVANTHVVAHAGRILALVENGFPWEVDGDLETIGYHDFDGRLEGPMTAHPKRCAETGEMHFFGYHFAPPYLRYHRANAEGVLEFSREIEIPRPIMMHDFAITRNHVIFMDLPLCFSAERAMKGGMPYAFEDDVPARLGVLRRDAPESEIIWLDIDPCFVFHPMNAFEAAGRIVLDVARYDSLWSRSAQVFDEAKLHRFEIDLEARKVGERPLDDLAIEFPRIKESLNGLPNRFGYAVWTRNEGGISGGGLVRYDHETGARDVWDGGGRITPAEAVFVPADEAGPEDEGWLLAFVYDHAREKSDLAVFDATRVDQGPIARIELPQRVPLGFHGSFLPTAP